MKQLLIALILLFGISCNQPETVETSYQGTIITARLIHEGDYLKFILPKEAMAKAVGSFKNRMVILDHDSNPKMAVGRILETELRFDEKIKKHYIWAKLKILDAETAHKIDLGLYYFLSVGIVVTEVHQQLSQLHNKPYITTFFGREVSFTSDPLDGDAHLEN